MQKITRGVRVSVMVFNATLKNISVIIVIFIFISGGNRSTQRKSRTYHKSLTHFIR